LGQSSRSILVVGHVVKSEAYGIAAANRTGASSACRIHLDAFPASDCPTVATYEYASEYTARLRVLERAIVSGDHRTRLPTSLMIGWAVVPIKHPIDLACHDKIVLVQSLDLLGAQRDRGVTPAKADIGVVAFGFGQFTYVTNKAKRFLKVAETKGSFDTVAILAQFPIRSLRLKTLRFPLREWRNAVPCSEPLIKIA
jgi:hypothetical protein